MDLDLIASNIGTSWRNWAGIADFVRSLLFIYSEGIPRMCRSGNGPSDLHVPLLLAKSVFFFKQIKASTRLSASRSSSTNVIDSRSNTCRKQFLFSVQT